MTPARYLARSLWFHRRSHLATAAAVAVAAMVLAGALAVGNSVRASLKKLALERIGNVSLAMAPEGRTFDQFLASKLEERVGPSVGHALVLRATLSTEDGGHLADIRLWSLSVEAAQLIGVTLPDEGAVLGAETHRLIGAPEAITLRFEPPSALPREAPLSGDDPAVVPIELRVEGTATRRSGGDFTLESQHAPPRNVFVRQGTLSGLIELDFPANVLLVGAGVEAEMLESKLRLPDLGYYGRVLPYLGAPEVTGMEVRTPRVFLERPVVYALESESTHSILTYFTNELRLGDRATPYSIVAGLDGEWPFMPPDLARDEVVINEWLADDLDANVGDEISMRYFVLGDVGVLVEKESTFRVRDIVPLSGAAKDSTLMPDFPGLADKQHCRDWEPGIPFDSERIRPKDEAYWEKHRGTPKAFVTLEAAQAMWANRFGDRTAMRFPPDVDPLALVRRVDPASLGFTFTDVRARALAAAQPAVDFGTLYLGFAFVLVASALLLASLLFALSTERRTEELGTLLALGWPRRRVFRTMLLEGALVAFAGAVIGSLLAGPFASVVLSQLASGWREAVRFELLDVAVSPRSILIGALAALVAAILVQWLALRSFTNRRATSLLTWDPVAATSSSPRSTGFLAIACVVAGIALAFTGRTLDGEARAGAFFSAGALLLTAGLLVVRRSWSASSRSSAVSSSLSFAWRGAARRPSRSLGTVALIAAGTFLVVAVGVFRHDPHEGATRRDSGTGGFSFLATTTVPVLPDALPAEVPADSVTRLRVREGDDASCLNLNGAQTPTLYGVDPAALRDRFRLTSGEPWAALSTPIDGFVPAIGDAGTVTWALKMQVGDTVELTDEHGRPLRLRIVGITANSILQGGLVISEDAFLHAFPSTSGWRLLLVDAPPEFLEPLRDALSDLGGVVEPASDRLARYLEVENTYIATFQSLGFLGLLLGVIGVGVVLVRNVIDRRRELAVLRAAGLSASRVRWLVVLEHTLLGVVGVALGTVAALVSVAPQLAGGGGLVASLTRGLLPVLFAVPLVSLVAATLALRRPIGRVLADD